MRNVLATDIKTIFEAFALFGDFSNRFGYPDV